MNEKVLIKSIKPQRTPSTKNTIPELTSLQAYNLVNALDSAQCRHVGRVYITADGYFFSEGNNLTEMVDLDAKIPSEALLLKQGKKQKRVLLPGKYIGRKRVIKEYGREEILKCRDPIIASYAEEQKALKAKLKAEKGDEDDLKQLLTNSYRLIAKNIK